MRDGRPAVAVPGPGLEGAPATVLRSPGRPSHWWTAHAGARRFGRVGLAEFFLLGALGHRIPGRPQLRSGPQAPVRAPRPRA